MTVDLAGVSIAWSSDPLLERDPFAPLVADLAGTAEAPSMVVTLRSASHRVDAPDPEGPDVVMYHGASRCVVEPAQYVILDGASRVTVARDGTRIDAQVHPESLSRQEDFTWVTMMMALALAMRAWDRFHVHGAAVVLEDGTTVVVAGDSGRGKSTSTLALLEGGARWLGDDTFFLGGDGGGGVRLYAMPRPFHVTPRTLDAFDRLRPCVSSPLRPVGKYDVAPQRAWPGRQELRASTPAWLVFPVVEADAPTAAEALDQASTMLALMPASAWVVLPQLDHHARHRELVQRLVSASTGIAARLGADMLAEPERLYRALRAAAGG